MAKIAVEARMIQHGKLWAMDLKTIFQLVRCAALLMGGCGFSQAMETVWVSSTVFSKDGLSPPWGAIDLQSVDGGGCVGSFLHHHTLTQDKSFELIRSIEGDWERVLISSETGTGSIFMNEWNTNHHVRVGADGVFHVLNAMGSVGGTSNFVRYGSKDAGPWIFEPFPNEPGKLSSGLSMDNQGGLHAVYFGSTRLLYWRHDGISWRPEGGEISLTDQLSSSLSLAVDSNGNPVLGYVVPSVVLDGDFEVFLLKKSGTVWDLISMFRGPYAGVLLRIDSQDRIHAVLPNVSLAQVRYLRLASTGNIETDQDFPLLGISKQCGLALDRNDVAHIVADSVLINGQTGTSTPLPVAFAVPAIAMVQGKYPYVFGLLKNSSRASYVAITQLTRSAPPVPVARSMDSLTWSWEALPGALQGFRLLRASDGSDLTGHLTPSLTTWTVTGLAPNTAHRVVARALYPGFPADSDPSEAVHTLANPPAAISLYRPAVKTLNASWDTNANPAGTLYRLQLVAPSGPSVSTETIQTGWSFESLDPGEPYALTINSVNGDGVETVVSSAVRVSFLGNVRETEFSLADGLSVAVRVAGPSFPPEPAFAVVPSESFPATPDGLTPLGVGFQLAAAPALPSGQSASVSLSWAPGQVNAPPGNSLVLARYDPDRPAWVALPTSEGTHSLRARTAGYGSFQVMAQRSIDPEGTAPSLFPNPFTPDVEDLSLRGVAPGEDIHIVDVRGRRIRELTADSAGRATWDGNDTAGDPAGSGVYGLLFGNGSRPRLRVLLKR